MHFGTTNSVLFYGYSDTHSTRLEQIRWAKNLQTADTLFSYAMPITIRQDGFLLNGENKNRLIDGLMTACNDRLYYHYSPFQTKEEASFQSTAEAF